MMLRKSAICTGCCKTAPEPASSLFFVNTIQDPFNLVAALCGLHAKQWAACQCSQRKGCPIHIPWQCSGCCECDCTCDLVRSQHLWCAADGSAGFGESTHVQLAPYGTVMDELTGVIRVANRNMDKLGFICGPHGYTWALQELQKGSCQPAIGQVNCGLLPMHRLRFRGICSLYMLLLNIFLICDHVFWPGRHFNFAFET